MTAQRRVLAREAGTSTHPLRTLLLLLAALLPVLGLLVVAPEASAHHSTGKVTFCHATSSSTHPYVEITTDPASIVRAGHDQHTGPVWSPTLGAHQAWGDVIPSFTWVDSHGVSHRYAGLNTDRLDVVAAGCVVPPVAVTVTAPTAADQTCEASGTVTITAVTGVTWTLDGRTAAAATHRVAAGTHTVAARALTGYAITGPTSWTLTVAPRTGCDIVVVTPVDPTVTPSTTCGVQGTWTIPSTTGVVYLVDGDTVPAGTYAGPVDALVSAQPLPGYRLADPYWSYDLLVAPARTCPSVVTPVDPTVTPSTTCGVQGTWTIPSTTGVVYLVDGDAVRAGTYAGPIDALVGAQPLPGYRLADPYWSYDLLVAAAEPCPTVVTPVAPTSDPSQRCGVQGTFTIPTTTGITYLIDGEPIDAGTYPGPVDETVTARAQEGYTLADASWWFHLVLAAAEACPVIVVVTPVDPSTTQSTVCAVEGTFTIPATTGITYLLDGAAVEAGTYSGPVDATVTAVAQTGYRLSTTSWSYDLVMTAAEDCSLPATGASLPQTGAPVGPLTGAAALLLLLGTALVVVATRRPTTR